ncbi:immunity 26/phosphotriesterase HocA family protein [Dickeya dadantii]|uniref:immunity 26/phosphotriesterase HocA family protein n=1 Tax=Dickeya dadantii TaxID=204038 RepID=UPI001CC4FC6E|nr:immunity 26/phosphotriesterase HocA family protein [Dickeya dadantii]UAY97063.1 immunity 26/phosphotriesterase HocA family protein [Dickeya dadantii]
MSDFKFWGWKKKPRTMLRFVKPGDIFCFRINDNKYGFGRIISKITAGHVAEVFNLFLSEPIIEDDEIIHAERAFTPLVIDTYGLFDKKVEPNGDWRIIGRQEDYTPKDMDGVYFSFGIGDSCKKKDIFGNVFSITEEEAELLPELSPNTDYDIKKLIEKI